MCGTDPGGRHACASLSASHGTGFPPVPPTELDQAINRTIHEDKYTWRMPREKIVEPDAPKGMMARFFDKVGAMLRKWARAVSDWLDKWLQKLFPHPHRRSDSGTSGYGWIESLQILLYGLVAAVLAALGGVALPRLAGSASRRPSLPANPSSRCRTSRMKMWERTSCRGMAG